MAEKFDVDVAFLLTSLWTAARVMVCQRSTVMARDGDTMHALNADWLKVCQEQG